MHVAFTGPEITDKELKILARNCKNLTILYFDICEKINDESLNVSPENLIDLNLYSFQITDKVLKNLSKKCEILTELSIKIFKKITKTQIETLKKHRLFLMIESNFEVV